jgi:endonuclease/exonuclease/phosphatase family metal-dependent hydrolase
MKCLCLYVNPRSNFVRGGVDMAKHMRTILTRDWRFWAVAMLCCFGTLGAARGSDTDALRVGAWNLQYFTSTPYVTLFESQNLRRTLTEVAIYRSIIESLQADIVALQEVGNPASLAAIAPNYFAVFSDQFQGKTQNVGNNIFNALLVSRRLQNILVDSFTIPSTAILYREKEKQSHKLVDRTARAVVGARFRSTQGDVVVLSVHLKYGCDADVIEESDDTDCKVFLKQLRAMNEYLRLQFSDGSVREAWILGDFNRSLQLEAKQRGVRELLMASQPQGAVFDFWPKYTAEYCQTTPRSRQVLIADRRPIDFSVCVGAHGQTCTANRTRQYWYTDEMLEWGSVLSDHCPISLDIGLLPKPSAVITRSSSTMAAIYSEGVMMTRSTEIEKDGERIQVYTDENGTDIIREDGSNPIHFGYDKHDEVLESYGRDGWVVVRDDRS